MTPFLWAVVLVLPQTLAAQEMLPALFNVTDVVAGDVLNIRTRPSANSPIIGALARNARRIEVVDISEDGRWGRINFDEGTGYVALRFLDPQPGPAWTTMQVPLSCFGTEPFWSFTAIDGDAVLEVMDSGPVDLVITEVIAAAGRSDVIGVQLSARSSTGFASLQATQCSDGMSDRAFGISMDLFLLQAEGATGYSGCCSLRP